VTRSSIPLDNRQSNHVPGGLKGRGARSEDRLAVAERATIRVNVVSEDIPLSATRERAEGFPCRCGCNTPRSCRSRPRGCKRAEGFLFLQTRHAYQSPPIPQIHYPQKFHSHYTTHPPIPPIPQSHHNECLPSHFSHASFATPQSPSSLLSSSMAHSSRPQKPPSTISASPSSNHPTGDTPR